jgi:hypothetical protein
MSALRTQMSALRTKLSALRTKLSALRTEVSSFGRKPNAKYADRRWRVALHMFSFNQHLLNAVSDFDSSAGTVCGWREKQHSRCNNADNAPHKFSSSDSWLRRIVIQSIIQHQIRRKWLQLVLKYVW